MRGNQRHSASISLSRDKARLATLESAPPLARLGNQISQFAPATIQPKSRPGRVSRSIAERRAHAPQKITETTTPETPPRGRRRGIGGRGHHTLSSHVKQGRGLCTPWPRQPQRPEAQRGKAQAVLRGTERRDKSATPSWRATPLHVQLASATRGGAVVAVRQHTAQPRAHGRRDPTPSPRCGSWPDRRRARGASERAAAARGRKDATKSCIV